MIYKIGLFCMLLALSACSDEPKDNKTAAQVSPENTVQSLDNSVKKEIEIAKMALRQVTADGSTVEEVLDDARSKLKQEIEFGQPQYENNEGFGFVFLPFQVVGRQKDMRNSIVWAVNEAGRFFTIGENKTIIVDKIKKNPKFFAMYGPVSMFTESLMNGKQAFLQTMHTFYLVNKVECLKPENKHNEMCV